MTLIHIVAGLLSILAGTVALTAPKGSRLHRKSGMVFTIAILTMTSTAFVMATFFNPNRLNIVAASLTFYLVATAFLTMRPVAKALLSSLMLIGFTVAAFAYSVAIEKLSLEDVSSAPFYFVFGSVALLGAFLDVRVLRVESLQGGQRLVRHLWRMSTAMLIATMSFFFGQPDFFPEPLRHQIGLRAIPVVLVVLTLIYWLARVGFKGPRAVRPRPAGADERNLI